MSKIKIANLQGFENTSFLTEIDDASQIQGGFFFLKSLYKYKKKGGYGGGKGDDGGKGCHH